MFDEHGSPVGTPAYMENPRDLRQLPQPRADAPHRRRVGRADGAARRGDEPRPGRRARCSWAGRGGCRTWCSRSRSIPRWAAASGSWPPRSRSSASATTSPRARPPTPTSSCVDASARLIAAGLAPGRLAPGGPALRGRARGRAAGCRLGRGVQRRRPPGHRRLHDHSAVRLRRRRRQDHRRRAAAGEPHPVRDAVLDRRLGRDRLDRGARVRAPARRSRRRADRRLAPDRRGQPRGAHRGGFVRRARRSGARLQLDGGLAGRGPRGRSWRRPTRSWSGTRRWRSASRTSTRELRQAQDMLLRSRALAALGELGAGVAHEINNPLAGVLGIAQLMLADLPASHPARPMAQDIEAQALRIRKIVANLLAVRAATGGRGRQGARPAARARRCRRAVRAERSRRRRHHHRARLRDGDPAGARQHRAAAGGVHPADSQRARRHAERRNADHRHQRARRRAGARHRRGHRPRHQRRAPAAHLRSVLHDQERLDRDRHGPVRGAQDHRGPRRLDRSRKRHRQGHDVRADFSGASPARGRSGRHDRTRARDGAPDRTPAWPGWRW